MKPEEPIEFRRSCSDEEVQGRAGELARANERLQAEVAERARVEEALRESERQLRLVTDNVRDMIWLTDLGYRTTWISPSVTRLRGYTLAELAEMPLDRNLTPASLARARELSAAQLTPERLADPGAEVAASVELEFFRKDGSTFWAESVISLLRDVTGEPSGFLGVARDITDRRRAEAELRSARAFLDSIINTIADPVFVKDDERRFVLVNDALCTVVGRPRESLLGEDGDEMFPEDQVEVFRKVDAEVLETGVEIVNEESLSNLESGEVHTIVTRKTRYIDPDGKKFLVGVIRDITERKRVERAMEASEKRYRRLFEAAKDGILILDADTGKIVDVNPFLIELTGFTYEDFLDKHLWEIGAFKDVAASKDSFAELQVEKHVRYEDLPLRTHDGRKIDVEFVSNVYRVDDEDVVQCNIRDISARKRAEAEHARLEEQLRASQKMEAVGGLAGGIAHDFNNLLSVILSYTGFVLDGVHEGDPIRADLLEVKDAAERAAALTNQLLAFSRKQVLHPVPLSLNQVAAGIEKMLRRIIGEDIDLVQTLAPDLGLTLADPGQIEQVIMNLVVNARDAMPGGGKLTIETANVAIGEEYSARHVDAKPGPYVQLTITDTGCGMDEQIKARLFEPFFTTKEKGKGTGLGLSTVYGIVKQSGGNIWVYSELGEGTTFKVYLPRDPSATTATAPKPSSVPRRDTGTETILLVEDEEALRRVFGRTLRAAGYRVLTAADGDEALATSARYEGEIHLLLTDVVMPRMSGSTLARGLAETRPTLEVLYMSGYTNDAIVHHGMLDAGTHFLSKPFTAADLTRKVREVLDGGVSHHDERRQAIEPGAETEARPPDTDALRALPTEPLDRLRKAAIAARYDEIVELVETIRSTAPDVAAWLRRMADDYDYVGIRDFLGERK